MGQNTSSVRSKGVRQRSFRGFVRRSKLNKSNLSHTFNLAPSEDYSELMNINTATEEQLMTLPGVNRQLAREIVRHRQMIGRFKRVDDLALVSGIGAEKLELLRPEICTNTRKQVSRASSCTQSLDSVRLSERSESRLCSVNSSSVFQLQCVPGLNQEIAANIVDYRNKKGPFKSLDDLIKVRGMDIVRLSTVKQHLTLDNRKCESAQNISNGFSNASVDISFSESMLSGLASTPRPSQYRKTLSAPIKYPTLPNGFANAPVNDILDLLSAYSHRPIVEEEFRYERNGVRCCRLASWNLHQLSIDKVMNPGVREVVCRTILENKLSIIAIQDVLEEGALKILRDELNSPSLRRVREWKPNSHMWEYCVSGPLNGKYLGFVYDAANKGILVEDIGLEQICMLTEKADVKTLVRELAELRSEQFIAAPQAFLLCGRPVVLVNVYCRGQLNDQDIAKLETVVQLADRTDTQLAVMGEMLSWDNVHSLKSCQALQKDDITTSLDNSESRSVILSPPSSSHFNGHSGVVKVGLSHLAIPRGWSWGGPASPYCPVWAEIKVPD